MPLTLERGKQQGERGCRPGEQAAAALERGKLVLQTHNPEHEEAEEELEVQYQGGPLEIGFNVNYLMDATG